MLAFHAGPYREVLGEEPRGMAGSCGGGGAAGKIPGNSWGDRSSRVCRRDRLVHQPLRQRARVVGEQPTIPTGAAVAVAEEEDRVEPQDLSKAITTQIQ
jgi:hypothetical protein